MADADEPQYTTLAQRIAALNAQKNFAAEEQKAKQQQQQQQQQQQKRPPPPPRPASKPAPPPRPARSPACNEAQPAPADVSTTSLPPKLPTRPTTQPAAPKPSPALPPRRPTLQPQPPPEPRRNSASSEVSYNSTASNLSGNRGVASSNTSITSNEGRKLPPAYDPASLPPLPPKRSSEAKTTNGTSGAGQNGGRQVEPPRPSLPPRLPSRPAKSPTVPEHQTASKPATPRRLPPAPEAFIKPPPRPASRPAANGVNGHHNEPPPLPTTTTTRDARDEPPPVPLSSRPSASQIEAIASRTAAAQAASCLMCRDFSSPDAVAAQYPRHTLPRDDPIGYLARALCDPFPSFTDKARAIFTWFHHNVDYDWENFCNGTVNHRASAAETILNGKAVCAGYAGGYKAIATQAGMECIVISGHGKGIGYTALKKGEPVPPKKASGHAWNAVRIDGGEWKLLDSCWGAGHVDRNAGRYNRKFTPIQFIASNEVFGQRHYPSDDAHFFRADQRVVSWEEYYRGDVADDEPVQKYGKLDEEGCAGWTLAPAGRHLPVHSGEVVRFQVAKLCEHWTSERNGRGKPYLFLLVIHGVDGAKDDRVPLETDGYWWWLDVRSRDLGAPGQAVSLVALTSFNNEDARGVSKEEYLRLKGRVGMAWSGLARWELV